MTTPDPFTLALALLPLIAYLLLVGGIRFSGRALVSTGTREIASLGLAIIGLIAVGPAQLFFPNAAGALFGASVWAMLAVFYLLCLAFVCLTTRQKLTVYGRQPDEVFPCLLKAAASLDADAVSEREKMEVYLPDSGIRLRLDAMQGTDYVQVVAFEPNVSPAFWAMLLGRLRSEIAEMPATRKGYGSGMILVGALMLLIVLVQAASDHTQLVDGLRQFLFRR